MQPSNVSVHRCRFIDYNPSPITAIAFPPVPISSDRKPLPRYGYLAAGRANGNIELMHWAGQETESQTRQMWTLSKVLPGPNPSKIDSLVFASKPRTSFKSTDTQVLSDLRLFSSGRGSEVLEWDLGNGWVKRTASSQGGVIWSMVINPSSTLLALGCEDGTIRVLSIVDDSLTYIRHLDRVKARILSLAWGPPVRKRPPKQSMEVDSEDETEDIWTDSWLVAGCSDSSIRRFNFETGRMLDRMTTDKARGEQTLVWAVGVLADGTIVSGDSLGTVKFWDSKTSTQIQTFKPHGADVLCLAIGPEGRTVYTSGVDQKICQISLIQTNSANSITKWVHTSSRRLHSHDVRTIAVWPPYTLFKPPIPSKPQIPLLVTGGLDMSLLICPCAADPESMTLAPSYGSVATFSESHYQRLPYASGLSSPVQLAREARIIISRHNTSLSLWKLKKSVSPEEVGLLDLERQVQEVQRSTNDDWEKILDMELQTMTNLLASGISSDGKWIAASDLNEVKLFHILSDSKKFRPKKTIIKGLPSSGGSTSLFFTFDSSKLIIGASMGSPLLHVVDLTGSNGTITVLRTFDHHRKGDNENVIGTMITHIMGSPDGQWLASADSTHRIYVFNLDSVQHHCTLPSFPHAIAALSFNPTSPSLLLIGFANNTIQAFDVEARQFPAASSLTSLIHLHDPIFGITFDPSTENSDPRALVWGSGWICKQSPMLTPSKKSPSKKRRRFPQAQDTTDINSNDGPSNIQIVTRYRPILLAEYVGPGELVVVERPLLDLLQTLSPAYFKPRYGS